MQRIVPLLLCVIGCTWIGLARADALRRRVQRLSLVREGLCQLVSTVRHTNQPLYTVAEAVATRSGCPFWKDFSDGLQKKQGVEKAWSGALTAACARDGCLFGLDGEDRAVLLAFSNTLGKTDRRRQAENAQATLDALDARIDNAESVYREKGRVYRTLGLFCGLGLAILLW